MKKHAVKEFQEACDKIGGEYNDGMKIHTCKLKGGVPSDGGELKEMELHENGPKSTKDFSVQAKHRDKDGATSGFINGDAEELEIQYGREGMHSAKMIVRNNEAETKVRMTNTTTTKPYPEQNWGP